MRSASCPGGAPTFNASMRARYAVDGWVRFRARRAVAIGVRRSAPVSGTASNAWTAAANRTRGRGEGGIGLALNAVAIHRHQPGAVTRAAGVGDHDVGARAALGTFRVDQFSVL